MRLLGPILVLLLVLAVAGTSIWVEYATVDYVAATVRRDPERECRTTSSTDSQGHTAVSTHCDWKVYTESEVFRLDDSLLFWQFNSADTANALRPGQTYCLKVNGWRVGWLSMFRKIINLAPPARCGAI